MKTRFLFGALAACGLLTACSSDEPANQTQNGGGIDSYVNFSIASSNVGLTRANVESADKDAKFEEGSASEETVANVVLFFYDESGNAINVNMGSSNTNYKVINPTLSGSKEQIGETSMNNVENWFNQTVTITSASTISSARVLALVNAKIDSEGRVCDITGTPISGSISKSSFYSSIFSGDYDDEDTYVMSTSVYVENNAVCSDVKVNIYDTKDAAENDPAVIYVERVRARASVIAGEESGKYDVNLTGVDLPEDVTADNLKVKVLGWDLNTTAKNAYLFKQLNPNVGFDFIWNDPNLHRSYWETPINLQTLNDFNASFKPNEITTQPGSNTFKYCNPNTTTVPTKVLVCTQLVDASDNPVEIASWYGNTYKLADLKTAILAASPKSVYVKTGENEYTNITGEYVDFVQGNGINGNMDKSWMAYPILKTKINDSATEEIQYYKMVETSGVGGGRLEANEITVAEAMELLGFTDNAGNRKLQGAKIWKDGYAYYYVDIVHLGDKTAMVRNHSYTIKVNGFSGLGTPIFNPGQVIPQPTRPEDDKLSYVSVTMNVLSWRIIPVQEVTFQSKN